MSRYQLYLESGPRKKKTMVHVFAPLGCVATGPTTDAALAATPGMIRRFLRFLRGHGEPVDAAQAIETEVREHVTEGVWLGNGDPSIVFAPDLEPLDAKEMEKHIARLEWMRTDMAALVADLSEAQWEEKPLPKGRSIQGIFEHVLESEYAYMMAFGRPEGLPGSGSIVKKREGDLLSWMARVRAIEIERLRSLNEQERSQPFVHWKYTRTARKVVRRMLEHQWEHLVELEERLGVQDDV